MYVVGAMTNPPKNPRSGEKMGNTIASNVVETAIPHMYHSKKINVINVTLDLNKTLCYNIANYLYKINKFRNYNHDEYCTYQYKLFEQYTDHILFWTLKS